MKNEKVEYEGEKILFQIERRENKFGEIVMVIAQKNMKIPQFSALTGDRREIDERGLIPQKRVVDLTDLK